MEIIPLRLISRTSSVKDWECPRARYYGFEFGGKGISKATTSLALSQGSSIHDSLAAIATFSEGREKVPIDDIARLAYQQMYDALTDDPGEVMSSEVIDFAKEQATLTEGLIRGFYKHVWPRLRATYPTIIAIEKEVEYPIDPDGRFIFMAKPDLLMEDYAGEWHYIEYKSTSSKKNTWINSWDTAVQLHSSIKAVEATMGRAPVDVTIVGLYKGYESYGKQSSPFCYGYMKKGNPPFTTDQVQYEYKAGFKRYPTWEMEGGISSWVEDMPGDVLGNNFPMTPPIMVNEDLVDRFFAQRLIREKEILGGLQRLALGENETTVLDEVFPQRFDKCFPSYGGYKCDFVKLCHGSVQDPLKEGFQERVPHHERELKLLEEVEVG